MAQGPARRARGAPPPTVRAPIATGRVRAREAGSVADEVVLKPRLPRRIELVARRLSTDVGASALELGAHPHGQRLVELRQLLHHPLDTEPARGLGPVLAHLPDPGRAPGHQPHAGVAEA